MERARLWAAKILLACARAVGGGIEAPKPEPEEEPAEEAIPVPVRPGSPFTARAARMIAEGENLARSMLPRPKETERPLGGSLAARAEASRNKRAT